MYIRVSVTDLDAFRYFRENEHVELENFLAQMRRQSEPTEAMLAGTALHKALELAQTGEFDALEADGYRFEIAADASISLPDIREMKATKEYRIGDCIVTLVGKVDAALGPTIYDHKFTSRYDPDRFLSGYQWRAYLDIFEANHFVWNIFEGRAKSSRDKGEVIEGVSEYVVTRFHVLGADRYPEMHRDLVNEIAAFVDMARVHLLEKFKKEAA
jgi:hypothetical protein